MIGYFVGERLFRNYPLFGIFKYMSLRFYQLLYSKNMECLLESLNTVCRHIGVVSSEIWFDNTSMIVKEIIKCGDLDLTECLSASGTLWGQGCLLQFTVWMGDRVCENRVKYSQRSFLVPVPGFLVLADYNDAAFSEDDSDWEWEYFLHNETRQVNNLDSFVEILNVKFMFMIKGIDYYQFPLKNIFILITQNTHN